MLLVGGTDELAFDVSKATSMDTVHTLSHVLGPNKVVSASATQTGWLGSREMFQLNESELVQGELRNAIAKCGIACNVQLLWPMSGYVFLKELRKRLLKPRQTPQVLFVIVNDKYLEDGGNHWTLRVVGLGAYAGNPAASASADVAARPVAVELNDDENALHQGNMRVRRYSHSQLRVVVLAYSQVTHSVRVMQLQLPVLADFCK